MEYVLECRSVFLSECEWGCLSVSATECSLGFLLGYAWALMLECELACLLKCR